MASLLSILQSGAGGLNTAQGMAATASNNLSNVNTPGYAKQTANLVASGGALPWDPGGVQISSVTQSRDRFLEQQIPASLGSAGFSQAQADALSSVGALDPAAAGGLSSALSDFYSALRAAAQNPGDSGLRRAAVGAARTLALAFNSTSSGLESARTGLDAQVSGQLDEVNQQAAQLAALNGQIRIAASSGAAVNDLLDARQKAQDRLAELTGARPVPDAQGDVSMMLPGGEALVSGRQAATLQAVTGAGGHVTLQLQKLDGSGAEAVADASIGGAIGGALDVRDGTLATAGSSLDQLASDLGSAINAVHRQGYAIDHSTGRDLFTVGAVSGAAGRIAVDAGIAADPSLLGAAGSAASGPGDGANLVALIATEQQTLASGASAGNAFSGIVSRFGADSAQATAQAAHDGAVRDHLSALRESASGVSVDEELVGMQRAQRAYEAMGRVMNTTSTMLDTLMALK